MRRLILFSFVAAVGGALAASYVFVSKPWLANQQHDRWFEKPGAGSYQKNRRAFTARLAGQAEPGRIWFIGHSHIEGLDVAQVDPRGLNLGIGGERLAHTRARLADYHAIGTAAAVVFAIGANDLPDTEINQMHKQAQAVLDAVPADIPVVWSLVMPVDATMTQWMPAAKIAATNASWSALCASRPRCRISDATSLLADSNGYLRSQYQIGDGEHLSSDGYAVWRRVLKQDLAKVLAPEAQE